MVCIFQTVYEDVFSCTSIFQKCATEIAPTCTDALLNSIFPACVSGRSLGFRLGGDLHPGDLPRSTLLDSTGLPLPLTAIAITCSVLCPV